MRAPAYAPPRFGAGIELDLSRNEGRVPRDFEPAPPSALPLARYPDLGELEAELARRFGVAREQVLVTAGADDALMRCCLATLEPSRSALLSAPTFQMIPRYVALAGGAAREVDWLDGPFPTEAFLDAATPEVSLAFVVSPNNPTGCVASPAELDRIARGLPDALVVLDAAYAEFADEDATARALEHENVVVLRTLSKAWGLAGLRVGFALGSPDWIRRLAAAGNPFPVSAASAAIALERLRGGEADVRDYVAAARRERGMLVELLQQLGATSAAPSQGNFVLARDLDSEWVRSSAAALGVALRTFPDEPRLANAVRIALPGDPEAFRRLARTLETTLAPEALLFDMDGVLADVSGSYRSAILETARAFGVELTAEEVQAAKDAGNANDDWELTWRLLAQRGVKASLADVTQHFEELYQGDGTRPGLRERETLTVARATLAAWRERYRLGVVTGRPRADALRFLERFGLTELFDAIVCREDGPLKPSPWSVQRALELLDVERAWMLGDTRDDLEAARAAGVLPLGMVAPGADSTRARRSLLEQGAARVLESPEELRSLLR